MNNEEAKFILQGYRPNGTDAGDAAFQAALEQVQRDPALREWFARQQAFDAAVSAKLNTVPVPAGLREAILAGARVTAPVQTDTSWWRSPVWLAAAASVAVIFATTLVRWPKLATADTALARYVSNDAAHDEHHGGHGTDSLQAMLGDPATRLGRGLPISFAALRRDGCRTVTYEGREVLEVCFNRGGVWFHAYIGRRSDFPALASAPTFLDMEGISVASWADEAHVYLVASKAGRAALQQLL
jgi:hypothetical protein